MLFDGFLHVLNQLAGTVELHGVQNVQQMVVAKLFLLFVLYLVESVAIEEQRFADDVVKHVHLQTQDLATNQWGHWFLSP